MLLRVLEDSVMCYYILGFVSCVVVSMGAILYLSCVPGAIPDVEDWDQN